MKRALQTPVPMRPLHAVDADTDAPGRPDDGRGAEASDRPDELAEVLHQIDHGDELVLLVRGVRGSGRSSLLRAVHRLRPDRTLLIRPPSAGLEAPWDAVAAIVAALAAEGRSTTLDHDAAPPGPRSPARRDVVLFDDFDLIDDRGRAAVALLAAHRAEGALRIVGTVRSPSTAFRSLHLPTLHLGEIAAEALVAAVPDRTRRVVDPATLQLLARASGGSPGVFERHLAQLTAAQRAGQAALPLPLPPVHPEAPEAVQARYELDREDHEVLRRLSGAPAVSAAALHAFIGSRIERLEPLVARGLVAREHGYVSVAVPELRSLLYWTMPPSERSAVHADGAAAEEGCSPDLRDWHRSHARPDGDAGALYAAAISMLSEHQADGAIEIGERAMSLASAATPVEQQLAFAETLLLHGLPGMAARHLPPVGARLSRRQRFRRLQLALTLQFFDRADLRLDAVDSLVGRYRLELPWESAVLLCHSGVLLILRGEPEAGVARIRSGERLVPGPLRPDTLPHWALRLADAISARVAPSEESGWDPHDLEPEIQLVAALAATWEERYEDGREGFAIIVGSWQAAESPWRRLADVLAVENELRAGNVTGAADLARRVPPEHGPRTTLDLAAIAVLRDEREEADALLDAVDERSRTAHLGAVGFAAIEGVRGLSALLRGDPVRAVQHLLSAAESANAWDPGLLRGLPDLIEAQWRSGDLRGARESVERMAAACGPSPSRWARLALARCHALLDDDPVSALVALAGTLEAADGELERGRVHALIALTAAASGRSALAEDEARTARRLLSRAGAVAWARLVGAATTPTPGWRSGLPELTETELAVLRLARRGAHNREIAAALFMSLRSVELRLTQIYRKFDARSRSHLFTLLPEDWPEDRPLAHR